MEGWSSRRSGAARSGLRPAAETLPDEKCGAGSLVGARGVRRSFSAGALLGGAEGLRPLAPAPLPRSWSKGRVVGAAPATAGGPRAMWSDAYSMPMAHALGDGRFVPAQRPGRTLGGAGTEGRDGDTTRKASDRRPFARSRSEGYLAALPRSARAAAPGAKSSATSGGKILLRGASTDSDTPWVDDSSSEDEFTGNDSGSFRRGDSELSLTDSDSSSSSSYGDDVPFLEAPHDDFTDEITRKMKENDEKFASAKKVEPTDPMWKRVYDALLGSAQDDREPKDTEAEGKKARTGDCGRQGKKRRRTRSGSSRRGARTDSFTNRPRRGASSPTAFSLTKQIRLARSH